MQLLFLWLTPQTIYKHTKKSTVSKPFLCLHARTPHRLCSALLSCAPSSFCHAGQSKENKPLHGITILRLNIYRIVFGLPSAKFTSFDVIIRANVMPQESCIWSEVLTSSCISLWMIKLCCSTVVIRVVINESREVLPAKTNYMIKKQYNNDT